MASFWDSLFESPQSQAYEDIYKDWGDLKTPEDIQKKYGLKKRKMSDVSQAYNPYRANLATREAQANQSAGSRMTGSNATPQASFSRVTSAYAPMWGELEGNIAKTGLETERSDEGRIAEYLRNAQGEKMKAAGGLSQSSPFEAILGGAATAAKFINPAVGAGLTAAKSALGGGGVNNINPSSLGVDTNQFQMPTSLSSGFSSPLNASPNITQDTGADNSPMGGIDLGLNPVPSARDAMGGYGLESMPVGELDDGSWGMNKRHGYNSKLGKFGFWNINNQDVNFLQ